MLTPVVARRREGQDGERPVDVDIPEGDRKTTSAYCHLVKVTVAVLLGVDTKMQLLGPMY